MPIIAESTYRPGWLYRRVHPSTILPTLVRSTPGLPFVRERLEMPDGDFIDLDCLLQGSSRAVILCHGLSYNSIFWDLLGTNNSLPRYLAARGFDVWVPSLRGGGLSSQPWDNARKKAVAGRLDLELFFTMHKRVGSEGSFGDYSVDDHVIRREHLEGVLTGEPHVVEDHLDVGVK